MSGTKTTDKNGVLIILTQKGKIMNKQQRQPKRRNAFAHDAWDRSSAGAHDPNKYVRRGKYDNQDYDADAYCPKCGKDMFIDDHGDLVCFTCGYNEDEELRRGDDVFDINNGWDFDIEDEMW
jgi:ribosomal protein S27AE